MANEPVQRLMDDHRSLLDYLREKEEISLLVVVEASFPKVTLLAAASDLERKIETILISHFTTITSDSEHAVSFIRNKAIKRQFHSYFDWEGRSANGFFGLFGVSFRDKMKQSCRGDNILAQAIKDFCEIGDLRNQLVHRGYATFTMEKTASEMFDLYSSALYFVEHFDAALTDS